MMCQVTLRLAAPGGAIPSLPSGVKFTPAQAGIIDGRVGAIGPVVGQPDRSGRVIVSLVPSNIAGDYTVRIGTNLITIRVPDQPAASFQDIVVREPTP